MPLRPLKKDTCAGFNCGTNYSHVSGLYRAERYKGRLTELTEQEKPLVVISAAIKANPDIWSDMDEYIHKNEHYNRDDDNDYPGVLWEGFKNVFGL